MANMKPLTEAKRGQLFLIGALAITLILVALTGLLNTAIYTENLASRGTNVGGSNDMLIERDVTDFVDLNMQHINRQPGLSSGAKRSAIEETTRSWADIQSVGYGKIGTIFRVEAPGSQQTLGFRAGQEDSTRDFTSESGDSDWLVSGNNNKVRQFEMVVDRSELASSGSGSEFTVHLLQTDGFQLTSANESYQFRIGQSGSDVEVEVVDDSGATVGSCSAPEDSNGDVLIQLSEGLVGGSECAALETAFLNTDPAGYPIYYENADNVEGTWEVYLQTSPYFPFATPFQPSGGYASSPSTGDVFAYQAIYAVDVTIKLSSDDGESIRTIRVAPGEHQ